MDSRGIVESQFRLMVYIILVAVFISIAIKGTYDIEKAHGKTVVERELDQLMEYLRLFSEMPDKRIFEKRVQLPKDVSGVEFIPDTRVGTLVVINFENGDIFSKWYDDVYVVAGYESENKIEYLYPFNGFLVSGSDSYIRFSVRESTYHGINVIAVDVNNTGDFRIRITGLEVDNSSNSDGVVYLTLLSPDRVEIAGLEARIYINGVEYPFPISSLRAREFDFTNHLGYQYIGGNGFSGDYWEEGEIGYINLKNGVLKEKDHLTVVILKNGKFAGAASI